MIPAMRRIAFLLVLLGASTLCLGQTKGLHKWGEGLTDWSGYQLADPSQEEPVFTAYTFNKERKTVRKDGIAYTYYDVTAAFRPALSWVRPEARTDAGLAGLRRDFDLLEYFARCYRDTLLTTGDKDGSIQMEYLNRFQQAREQARGGDIPGYSLSDAPFDITQRPWTTSRRGGGISLGAYGSVPLRSITNILGPSVGATLGIERQWGRSVLLVDFSAAAHRIVRRYTGLWGLGKNEKMAPGALASLNYGFEAVSSRVVRLGLHAGPAFGGYLFSPLENPTCFIGGPGVTEGLYLDLILSRTASFVGSRPEMANTALRFRVYGSQLWSLQQDGLIFPSVNLSISLHFHSHPLNLQ